MVAYLSSPLASATTGRRGAGRRRLRRLDPALSRRPRCRPSSSSAAASSPWSPAPSLPGQDGHAAGNHAGGLSDRGGPHRGVDRHQHARARHRHRRRSSGQLRAGGRQHRRHQPGQHPAHPRPQCPDCSDRARAQDTPLRSAGDDAGCGGCSTSSLSTEPLGRVGWRRCSAWSRRLHVGRPPRRPSGTLSPPRTRVPPESGPSPGRGSRRQAVGTRRGRSARRHRGSSSWAPSSWWKAQWTPRALWA